MKKEFISSSQFENPRKVLVSEEQFENILQKGILYFMTDMSKYITYILRHNPPDVGIELDKW